MKKVLKITIFIISLIISIGIIYIIKKYDSNILDEKSYLFISRFITPFNTKIAKVFSFIGSTLMVIIILAILLVIMRKKSFGIILNTINVTIISQALKFIIRRPRPIGIALIEETGFSFPSGHSMVNAGLYGFIIYLVITSKLKLVWKILISTILTILVLLIAVSRIYLGVHYITDVIGGFALATVCLIPFIEFVYKKKIA